MLRDVRDLLSRRGDCVHVTEAIGERLHHVRGEMRRLLNEKMEAPPINLRQTGRTLRHHAGDPRAVVAQQDVHFSLEQDEHLLALFTFLEKELAGRNLQRAGFLPKKLCWIHEGQSLKRTADPTAT